MKQRKANTPVSSSLQNNKKLHKKISEHIKQIVKLNNSALSDKNGKKPEQIPEKIIQKSKQTHKYLYKKTLINTKFQWLNKYLQNSQLRSVSMNINSTKIGYQKQGKQNQKGFFQVKKNRRSKTQAFQDRQNQNELINFEEYNNFHEDKHAYSEDREQLLKQRSLNNKILSQNHFRLKKSKSIKDKKNISVLDDVHLRQMLIQERKINKSNCERSVSKNQSFQYIQDKQNIKIPGQLKSRKVLKVFIDENTPSRQFLDCTSRLNNSSNLMKKNTSGYIKNKKRQYIYQSRQSKRQQSELLKIKRRFQEQITVEPWNLYGNEKQDNEQTDLIMNKHR